MLIKKSRVTETRRREKHHDDLMGMNDGERMTRWSDTCRASRASCPLFTLLPVN